MANKYLVIGAVAGGLLLAYLAAKGAGRAATVVAQAVNPFNNDNIINQGAIGFYQAVTGSDGTIGGDFYDATHGGRLDVTSNNNAAAASVNWLGEKATGQSGWTLGGAIYDWTH